MNSGIHGQRRNVESDARLQAKIQETGHKVDWSEASGPLPPVVLTLCLLVQSLIDFFLKKMVLRMDREQETPAQ